MDKNNIKTNKLKTIILITISILFFFYKITLGYGQWTHLANGRYLCNLSEFNTICGYTTYVPNIDGSRVHTIDYGDVNAHRAQLSGTFTIHMYSDMVYCCDNHRTTRRGAFDYTTYYVAEFVPGNNHWTSGTYTDANNDAMEFINNDSNFNSNNISGAFPGGIFKERNSSVYSWERTNRLSASDTRLFKELVPAYSPAPGFTNGMLYYGRLGKPKISDYTNEDAEAYTRVMEAAKSDAIKYAKRGMSYVFDQLEEDGKVDPISGEADLNGAGTYSQGSGNEGIGPMVTIMQEHNKQYPATTYAERGYVSSSRGYSDARAYVLTAARKIYNPSSYSYNPKDIQVAWWNLVDNSAYNAYRIGDGDLGREFSGKGITLRNEAVNWDNFIKNFNTPEKVANILKIYSNDAEAIINQDKKQYTIGPFIIDYPNQYKDFMYVKGFKITLKDEYGDAIELFNNEAKQDFDFIYPPGSSGTQGQNGLTKYYPEKGKTFYIRFDLTKTRGLKPVHIDLTPAVEYLSKCNVSGTFYRAYANTYPYIGHYNCIDYNFFSKLGYEAKYVDHDKHDCPFGEILIYLYYYRWVVVDYEDDPDRPYYVHRYHYYEDQAHTQYIVSYYYNEWTGRRYYYDKNNVGGTPATLTNPHYTVHRTSTTGHYHQRSVYGWDSGSRKKLVHSHVWVFQPYILMSRKFYSSDVGQPFQKGTSGTRTYSIVNKTASLDFTMRVGGMVFEDIRTGKDNLSNGTYNDRSDKKIANVMVLLYRHEVDSKGDERGEYVKSTWTNGDGVYSFDKLNEMYKYHVEFLYNGQYYEPTKLTTKETYEGNSKTKWENSSKAIDNYEERDEFNKKFEEVGSSNQNVILKSINTDGSKRVYTYESASKDVVEATGNIDAYGNINKKFFLKLGNNPNNPHGNIGFSTSPSIWNAKYGGYIANSMLRAYSARETTKNGKVVIKYDLYPLKGLFVANQTVYALHQKVVTGTIVPLYGTAGTNKNQTEKINLGLVKREDIDFALQKDVFNITFEMNGKKFVYNYHTRYESIPPEGMTMEDLIRKNGIKSALDAASEIHINNLTYKVNYSVLTRKGDDNKYAYYKEEDTRLVYREDYEYNSGLYRNLKVQNADGTTSQMTGREYDAFIEAKEKGELEIYVTYVITIRNFTSGLNGRVTEIVDHSDSEFTLITSSTTCTAAENSRNKVVQGKVLQSEVDKYRPYIGTGFKGEKLSNEKLNAMGTRAENQFSEMINITGTGNNKRYTLKNQNLIYLTTSENSIYRTDKDKNVELENFEQNGEYNTAYITGMENVYLTVIYNDVDLYVTYRVNKRRSNVNGDNNDYLIIDEHIPGLPIEMSSTNPKSNLAEIRGYKTYYSTYATAPNVKNTANQVNAEFVKGQDMYRTDEIAGILDLNSTPGNLKYAAREDEKPNDGRVSQEILNVVKENDADRAPLLRLVLNMDRAREVNGSTFEDARTVNDLNTRVGDGIKKFTFDGDGNYATGSDRAINGTRVQLIELVGNTEVIWKEVKVGDKENLTPVVDQYGLIGTYDLENTYYKTKTAGTTKTVPTGLVDNDTSHANDTTGHYRLLGFPTGDFIVRFIYGSDADTAVGSYGYDYTVVTNKTKNGDPLTNEIESLASYDSLSGIRLPPLADNNLDPTGNNNPYKNAKYYYRRNELGANEAADRSVNQNSYTGNDYKSTVYRAGYYEDTNHNHSTSETNTIDYNAAETGKYEFDFAINDNGKLLSDAKDIYARRKSVIDYSDNDQINHIAEVLASFEEKQDATGIANLLNELYNRTYMYADTGVIHVNTEYNSTERDMAKNDHSVGKSNYSGTGFFSISNLDFGLEERPKAQLKTNVQVANVKITMANKNVLFDATKTATNLQWNRHLGHGQDKGNIYTRGANYDSTVMKIPEVRAGNARGVVLATMDQETLQGATIEITYIVTVANIGEIDYYQKDRTVSGKKVPYCSWYNKHKTDNINIVTTKAKELVCYVGTQTIEGGETTNNKVQFSRNNLRFVKEDNDPVWEIVEVKNICKENQEATNIVNSRYSNLLKKYNTIIHTTNASAFYNKDLVPVMAERNDYDGDFLASEIPSAIENDPEHVIEKINKTDSVVAEKLKLVSTLSGDFSTNDMTYNNLVELVRIDNTVGRRMAFSIVGNQNPTADPREIDADFGEEISILPPYGNTQFDYYLGFGLAGIMILGGMLVMIFVRKKD